MKMLRVIAAFAALASAASLEAQPLLRAGQAPTASASASVPVASPTYTPPVASGEITDGPRFPALSGRVVDAADIIPANEEARLTEKLAALETQSRRQLVVATVPSLGGYEISDYGYQLGRSWGIGDNQRNDGVILLVAPNERKLRIESGYGMEGIITDGLSSLIINQAIVPKFKAGDYPGGIEAGVDALVTQMTLPEDEARKIAAQAAKPRQDSGGGIDFGTVVFLLIFFFFFVLPMLRAMRGGKSHRRGGMPPVIIFPGGFGSGGGGWSSGSDWGGGFGGGFSGGGGSFGGGGASGSW